MKWLVVTALLVFPYFLEGCGKKQSASITKECVVNTDQVATFSGHWPLTPVPLAVEAVDFSTAELQAIIDGINTWNAFFSASKGVEIYYAGNGGLSTQTISPRVTAATVCSQPIVTPSGFIRKVMIYKERTSWTYGSSAIAITSTCPVSGGGTYKTIYSAVMQINFVNFWGAGQGRPDLQSIVTHELGHTLGLGHSCGNLSSGAVACKPEYVEASMYPSLGFSGLNGQVKREVRTNDQERANCLY